MPEPAYTPQTWHDAPAVDTPLSSARLSVVEAALQVVTDRAAKSIRYDSAQTLSGTQQSLGRVNLGLGEISTRSPSEFAPADALPASVKSVGLVNRFDAARSVYNWKAGNTRVLRKALGAAVSGGRADVVFMGDSLLPGFDGTTTVERYGPPRQAGNVASSLLGCAEAGDGVTPAVMIPGQLTDRWSFTGTIDTGSTYPGLVFLNSGAALTYSSIKPGDRVRLFYGDNSSAFTYQIDGGAAVGVTPTGTSTIRMLEVTGLANTTHTVTVNGTGTFTFVFGASVTSSAGLAIHNLALGGSRCTTGGPADNWLDTTNGWFAFGTARRTMLSLAGITPAFVFCCLSSNDVFQGATVSQITAGLTAMRNLYPSADFGLIAGWAVPGTNPTLFDQLQQGRYQLADALDVPLIDWNDRVGGQAAAQVNGYLGADNTHPLNATSALLGRALGQLIAA